MNEVATPRIDKSIFKLDQFHQDLYTAVDEADMKWNALSVAIGLPYPILARILRERSIPDLCAYWWLCKWMGKPVEYYFRKNRPRNANTNCSEN